MISDKWTVLFTQFRTRTEVRGILSSTLTGMMEPVTDSTMFPSEINGLSTSNDREVMESYLRVKIFCDGKKERTVIQLQPALRAMFATCSAKRSRE
jgi:hypothetical protein